MNSIVVFKSYGDENILIIPCDNALIIHYKLFTTTSIPAACLPIEGLIEDRGYRLLLELTYKDLPMQISKYGKLINNIKFFIIYSFKFL